MRAPLAAPSRQQQPLQPGLWLSPDAGKLTMDCGAGLLLAGLRRRTSGPPPGPWAPPSLGADSWAWHDAGVLASLSKDASGTTPVANDGDDLGRAADLSGNGRHLTQSNAGLRCDYSASGLGGLAAIHGGGGGIRLERAGGITGAQSWGIAFRLAFVPGGVASLISLGGSSPGLVQIDGSGGGPAIAFVFSAAGSTANAVGFSPTLDIAVHRLVITFDGVSAYTCLYDGAPQTLTTGGTVATDSTLGGLFARNNGTERAGGYVRRIVVASRAITGADLAGADTWLQG